jgi:hypothetical protein
LQYYHLIEGSFWNMFTLPRSSLGPSLCKKCRNLPFSGPTALPCPTTALASSIKLRPVTTFSSPRSPSFFLAIRLAISESLGVAFDVKYSWEHFRWFREVAGRPFATMAERLA